MNLKGYAKRINEVTASGYGTAKRTIEYFIDAGLLLNEAKKLVPAGEWSEWVECNLHLTHRQINKCMRLGAHKAQVRAIAAQSEEPPTIDDLCEVLPKTNEEPTITEADPATLGYAGVSEHNRKTRDSDDWHTPGEYTDAARKVMGSIDLDPFSTPEANIGVDATRFLTIADDALITPWAGPETRNVWMNPPYGRGIMTKAIARFLEHYEAHAFEQAIVLCNAATDTYWYHDMWKAADMFCLTLGRIAFISGDKEMSGNTKGQVFFYFGPNIDKFKEVFSKHGGVADARDYK